MKRNAAGMLLIVVIGLVTLGAGDDTVEQLRQRVIALETRVAALERWRKEFTQADPAEPTEEVRGEDGPTVLRSWTFWPKQNRSPEAMLVRDRAARSQQRDKASALCGRPTFG